MRRTVIPVEQLFAWGKLNGIDLNEIEVKSDIATIDGVSRGAGLVSRSDHHANKDQSILISVPQDLILSQEQVERYAAIDKHLKMILDAAGTFGQVSQRASYTAVLQF
jgi:hypothetical protein